jgi:hypothetical protein
LTAAVCGFTGKGTRFLYVWQDGQERVTRGKIAKANWPMFCN